MRCRALLSLLSVATVAACVAPPRQRPVPAVSPAAVTPPAPPTAPAADWRDWPRTPGDWQHVADAGRPAARYRDPAGTTLFALTCDRTTRTVSLALTGPAAALTIRTTSTTRTLPVPAPAATDAPMPIPTVVATLAAADPLLDAMAFSRGRFTVARPGRPPLVLPAWAEVGRVTEDCRN